MDSANVYSHNNMSPNIRTVVLTAADALAFVVDGAVVVCAIAVVLVLLELMPTLLLLWEKET